jgi:hypothetical protein
MWNAGFGYTVETVQSNEPVDTVVLTDPEAGTSLDPNSRMVTIRRSAGPPPPPSPPQPAPQPVAIKDDGGKAKNDSKKKDDAKDESKAKDEGKTKDEGKAKGEVNNKDGK